MAERKETFNNFMAWMEEQHNLLPNLNSKFMGISMPFPQTKSEKNKLIESIKKLKDRDREVCIAVKYKQVEKWSCQYKEIVFIGNDYLHLIEIVDFMKEDEIELSIKNICIIYREFTDDFDKNIIGNASIVTSLNDLFSMTEIRLEYINNVLEYKYEDKQIEKSIIEYCCNEGDEEGKNLGYQVFTKALELSSKQVLCEGVLFGYPVTNLKINLIKSSCRMCFYRDYYYLM